MSRTPGVSQSLAKSEGQQEAASADHRAKGLARRMQPAHSRAGKTITKMIWTLPDHTEDWKRGLPTSAAFIDQSTQCIPHRPPHPV
jgi:hypothetical protein